MDIIDLHTHSTASDGTLPPRELTRLAAESGVSAIALTDHDSVEGLAEAAAAGDECGVEIIRGCELSVTDGARRLHILGLFLSERPTQLARELASLRDKRDNRNVIIIEKLQNLGIDITVEEVTALAGDAVGRPHIAQVLMAKGVVPNFQTCFEKYLGNKGMAYAPKDVLPIETAVALLREEKATVVLAHPYLLGLKNRDLETLVSRYKDMGLDAIEALYTDHSPSQTREYLALAQRLDLAVTGGSDFHGSIKPEVRLGVGKGKLRVPASLLTALKERRASAGLPA